MQNDPNEKKEDAQASITQKKNNDDPCKNNQTNLRKNIQRSRKLPTTRGLIGGPICSAIAIALTKTTGKPVRITDVKSSEDGNIIEATFEIIEE